MNFGASNFQIQGWPTPEIFIRRRGGRMLQEFGVAGLALLSVVSIGGMSRTVAPDSAVAGLALTSCFVNPPVTHTITDGAVAGLALKSVLVFTPLTRTVTEPAVAGLALKSVTVPTPITRTIGPDAAVAGLGLVSCAINDAAAWRVQFTVGAGGSITLPTASGSNNFQVDWGDGANATITSATPSHTYTAAGVYTVSIIGIMPAWNFAGTMASSLLVTKILQFGNTQLSPTGFAAAFYGCTNLTSPIPSFAGLSGITSLNSSFALCPNIVQTILSVTASVITANITDSRGLFTSCTGLTGNGSDFTSRTFSGSYTICATSSCSSYRTFFGCTGLTDYATLGPNWT
jgi:PKD domain